MQFKTNIILLILFSIAVSFSFSCNSSKTGKDSEISDGNQYFPVAQGNSWTYSDISFGENPPTHNVYVKSVTVEGTDKIVDLSSFPFFSDFVKTTKLRIKESGAVYVVGGDSKEELFLPVKTDFQTGSKWQFGQWSAYISKDNDTVVTKAGTYIDCILITYSIAFTFVSEIWLSRNVGIIKWGYNRTNPPTPSPSYFVLINKELNK